MLAILQDKELVVEYVIAQEAHLDMTPHIHVFLKVDRKVSWTPTRFDLAGFRGIY